MENSKKCQTCKESKLENFFTPYELKQNTSQCRECCSKRLKKIRGGENRELINKKSREARAFKTANEPGYKEERNKVRKKYKENNKEQISIVNKEYFINNKDKINEKRRERRKVDPFFKLRGNVSHRINEALKSNGNNKNGKKTWDYMPCTKEELKSHLENLFSATENLGPNGEVWMTWDTWGIYNLITWKDDDVSTWVWNIDHIIPHSEFKYDSLEHSDFKKCWSLSNLRPYSAKQNVIDGARKNKKEIK
jgi:hypothetical protein